MECLTEETKFLRESFLARNYIVAYLPGMFQFEASEISFMDKLQEKVLKKSGRHAQLIEYKT